jgi:hypothetical protein
MSLSAPKKATFYVAAVLWIIGLIGMLVMPDFQVVLNFGLAAWIGMLGGLILILGNMLDGF